MNASLDVLPKTFTLRGGYGETAKMPTVLYLHPENMKESLGHLFAQEDFCGDSDIKIISGMADGADTLAIRFADEFELTKILFPANWKLHHRMAGFLRNEDMMEIATHLVAFWDGKSKGTQHIIELAKNKGIPYRIFIYNQK